MKLVAFFALAGIAALALSAGPSSASDMSEMVSQVQSTPNYAKNNEMLRRVHNYFMHAGNPEATHGRSLALTSECTQIAGWVRDALRAEVTSCTAMFARETSRKHSSGLCNPDDDDSSTYASTQADAAASCTSTCYAALIEGITNATAANCAPLDDIASVIAECSVDADCYAPGETCVSGSCQTACTDDNPCDCHEICDTTAGYCKDDPAKPSSTSNPNFTIKGFLEFNKLLCLQKTGTTTYCYADVFTALESFSGDCTDLENTGCCWDSAYNFLTTCLVTPQINILRAFCPSLTSTNFCAGYTSLAGAQCINGASSVSVSSALVMLTGAAAVLLSLFRF